MQESNNKEEVVRVKAKKFIFHTCPSCSSTVRIEEESPVPKYFQQINDYLQFLLSKEDK